MNLLDQTNATDENYSLDPINCISKALVELHLKSVIDFSEYEYIKLEENETQWNEIILKILLCTISIIFALFGNIITIYNMVIKPNINKKSSVRYHYYLPNNELIKMETNSNEGRPSDNITRKRLNTKEKNNDLNGKETKVILAKISKPARKKSVNYFILNICFCDLIIVVFCSWIHLVNSVSENWMMGAFFCRFNTFVQGKTIYIYFK